jgi:multidrug efflux system outer membrane protein
LSSFARPIETVETVSTTGRSYHSPLKRGVNESVVRYFPLLLLLLTGCAVGPNYKRPALDVPTEYRRAADDTNIIAGAETFANLGWWEIYKDEQLIAYINEALTNSWDIKIAASRVLQAEAAARIARSEFFPNVYGGGDLYTTQFSKRGPTPAPPGDGRQREYGDLFGYMPAYEVDLWGRIRRANEAARARLLATRDAQQTVRQTLVAQVATTYLDLLELDLELIVAQSSYVSRTNSLGLTSAREQGGVAALQDVQQAAILVYGAEATIADTHRRIEQKENELRLLLGRNPGGVQRGKPLVDWTVRAVVPPGLPSSLVNRRPDIRSAEQQLRAFNADIGQAQAAFFPKVTLTGLYGYQTVALSDLFTGPATVWQFGPAVSVPLFTGGRLRANLALARAQFDESLSFYQLTVQNAFREVSDALIAYQRLREFRIAQEKRTEANRAATELANIRYEGGVTSYLEVLYNEQELLAAELNLAAARRNELLSVVQLYRALGGGWQEPVPPPRIKAAKRTSKGTKKP